MSRDLYDKLCNIIRKDINKKLVLITCENDPPNNKFKFDTLFEKYEEQIDDRNAFIDLISESQEKLLVEAKVIFQGKEIILGSLIDEDSKHLIRDDELFKLISGEKLEIGKSFSNLGDVEYYYIPRRFYRCEEIREEFTHFSSYADKHILNMDNTFLITYNSEDINLYVNEGLDIVLISASEYDFNTLCEKYKKKKMNIHWLKREDKAFFWQRTHGNFTKLRKFMNFDYSKRRIYEPQNVRDITDKTVIIPAVAGMGKSTVLTFLAAQTKISDPSLWVEKINMLQYAELLEKVKNENFDNKKAIDFLLEIVNLNSPFEKKLFEHRVNKQGKIALLLDGLDEISPGFKEKVFDLLNNLRKGTKVEEIWITTRPHLRIEMEDHFGVLSYSLQELYSSDQKYFFRKYFCKALGSNPLDNMRLYNFTARLCSLLSKATVTVDAERKSFCGIPLHLKLLAEVYVEDFKLYHDENEINLPKELDLIDLYKLFIKKKFDIYWKEKSKRDTPNPIAYEEKSRLYHQFLSYHKIASFTTLFSHHNILDILSAEEKATDKRFREYIKKEEERTGIVSIINETICFTHRSFAEYFATKFISAKLKSNYSTDNVWSFLISTLFIEEYCSNIRIFFYDKLKKNKELSDLFSECKTKETVIELFKSIDLVKSICNAVEANSMNMLNFLLHFAKGKLNVCDRICNTDVLTVAASKDNYDIAETLLRYVKDTDTTQLEKVLNVNIKYFRDPPIPPHLVDRETRDIILKNKREKRYENSVDPNDLDSRFFYDGPPLHIAVKENSGKMMDVLLKDIEDTEQLKNILTYPDKADRTAIYYAVHEWHFNDPNYILFKYIHKLNPDQRQDVICGAAMMTDDLGRPSGPETSPMYKAAKLAAMLENSKQQYNNLSSYIKNISELNFTIEFLIGMIKEGTYQAGCISSVLEKLMLESNFSVNTIVTDVEDGKTLLHLACESALNYKPPYIDLVKCFVDVGANVNVSDNHDTTPLHLAAGAKNGFKIVEYLVTKGADVNSSNSQGATPLHLAAGAENGFKVVEYLVTQGADYTIVDTDGRTPLHCAAQHDKLEVVKYVIEKGADFTCIDKYGKTPVDLAKDGGHQEVVHFLQTQCSKSDVDHPRLQASHNEYDFKQQKFPIKRRYDEI